MYAPLKPMEHFCNTYSKTSSLVCNGLSLILKLEKTKPLETRLDSDKLCHTAVRKIFVHGENINILNKMQLIYPGPWAYLAFVERKTGRVDFAGQI